MRIGKKRYRLRKSVRRALYSITGLALGLICAINTNAVAADTNVNIEEGRVSIEDYEYFKQKSVVKVTMPSTVQQIGFSSFEGCQELSAINLADGLSVIDNRAFAKCISLSRVDIPESTVFIGNAAFYGCESLDNVTVPSGIRALSNNLFYGCKTLSNITIPDSVTEIGQQCFYNCVGLTQIKLPMSLQTIADGAFYDCSSLKSLEIPDTVTNIGVDAFSGCDNLLIIADKDSYAYKYAKDNNLMVRGKGESSTLVNQTTTKIAKVNKPDVPATGVDTHYLLMLILMMMSGAGLIGLERVFKYY